MAEKYGLDLEIGKSGLMPADIRLSYIGQDKIFKGHDR